MNLPVSAVIVTYNEADLLPRCLENLPECQEIVIVDLGSKDSSREIAVSHGARLLSHPLVPFANLPRQFGLAACKHQWVISIDPDEVFPRADWPKIEAVILENPELAAIKLPCHYYFRGVRLRTTIWGKPGKTRWAVLNRERVQTTRYIHREFANNQMIHVFGEEEVEAIRHDWARSWKELLEKHRRYVLHEGEKMYTAGSRFSWRRAGKNCLLSLKGNLFDLRGITSSTGFPLSLFHAAYVLGSHLSLRRYQREIVGDVSRNGKEK